MTSPYHELAPPKGWESFEDLCLALFRAEWQDSAAQKNGRQGQQQAGVDVVGRNYAQGGGWWGVQCKRKKRGAGSRLSEQEIEAELAKADRFEPKLAHWIMATTTENDAQLQAYARQLSDQRVANGLCPVDVLFWDSIEALLHKHREVARIFYPGLFPEPPPTPPVLPDSRQIDISRIVKYAPEHLLGREAELGLLEAAWQSAISPSSSPSPASAPVSRVHLISFVALGGEGKTSLVARWLTQLARRDWPGCEAVFAWSFYSQGSDERTAASSDLFLAEALRFFGETAMAESSVSAVDKARHLAQVVAQKRVLLILDGLEPLQYPPTAAHGIMGGELRDAAMAQLLLGLASSNHGLCVLTTRYSIPDLKGFWHGTAPEHKLLCLPEEAGVDLLGKLKVKGTAKECAELVRAVQGHALSIHLFGTYLRDAHGGDIRQRDRVKLLEADEVEQGGHAWRVMDAYVAWLGAGDDKDAQNGKSSKRGRAGQQAGAAGKRALAILQLLGLFDRPASAACIDALLQAPPIAGLTEEVQNLDQAARNLIYTRLQDTGLLTVLRDGAGGLLALDAHPLLREYFANTLQQQQWAAWRAGHQRLYEFLCRETKDLPKPGLDDLQPLYQAVAHGCLAGLVQQACDEVYHTRILRRNEYYSTHKLGAFGADLGAVACFFTQPWQQVCPALQPRYQAWLLNQAAFRLRALGRQREASEPMRASLVMVIKQEDWENAAKAANNLSELGLTQGEVASALHDAQQAVDYADRSGDAFLRMGMRTAHADALHQAGQSQAALALFEQAEAMQAERQPDFPLLYSLSGFLYCDLLLAAPELAAWQATCQGHATASALASCHAVSQRAAQTLEWIAQTNWLLDIALDHLTLGRAALYAAILSGSPSTANQGELQPALDGLRRAGTTHMLPLALLTQTWQLAHSNDPHHLPQAAALLNEAHQIAERGPMPLFLADIHLHRAALFHRSNDYPWQSPQEDAQAARRLIKQHGYLRRLPFLEAVEQALGLPPN